MNVFFLLVAEPEPCSEFTQSTFVLCKQTNKANEPPALPLLTDVVQVQVVVQKLVLLKVWILRRVQIILHVVLEERPTASQVKPKHKHDLPPRVQAIRLTLIFLMESTCTESLSSILRMVSSIRMWCRCFSMNFFSSSIRSWFLKTNKRGRQ